MTRKGFTLIEILLVVAAIAILAGIVILAINPSKQLGDTRNAQRKADVNTILNAVYQHALDNNNSIFSVIQTTPIEICATDAVSCVGYVDLSMLTANEKYLTAIPDEPLKQNGDGAGYRISKSVNNRITVTAQYPENDETISATR